jgi:drug/metabolite transporter (DMT)-like permease
MAITSVHLKEHSAKKNAVFVSLIVLGNAIGNLLLAMGMNHMPGLLAVPFLDYLRNAFSSASLLGGTFLVTVSMVAQLYMYTWADLSYVLPVTASGYLVTAVLSKYVLQENVSVFRWVGVVLISFGVLFVARTPSDTKHLESVQQ